MRASSFPSLPAATPQGRVAPGSAFLRMRKPIMRRRRSYCARLRDSSGSSPRCAVCGLRRNGVRCPGGERKAMYAPGFWFARTKCSRAAGSFARRSSSCHPANTHCGETKFTFMTGTAISRVEAPRGEVMYSVSWKENSRNPSRVHVRTPTYANMPAVRWMVLGARVADAPLIQASIDPCYSCTDR